MSFYVSARDIVEAASDHGMHVHITAITAAVRYGELTPAGAGLYRFTRDEANRWLTELRNQRRTP